MHKSFDDNFIPGLIVGGITGTVINFIEIILVDFLKFGQVRFMDYAGLLAYGRRFHTFLEVMFAFFIQISFAAAIGVAFVCILDRISTKYLELKGIFLALNFWYFIFSLVLLFKVPYVLVLTFDGAIENFVSSLLFGLCFAKTYRILYLRDKKW